MVESPCIKVCRVVNGVCAGCYRTIAEIQLWMHSPDVEKIEIVKRCQQRATIIKYSPQ